MSKCFQIFIWNHIWRPDFPSNRQGFIYFHHIPKVPHTFPQELASLRPNSRFFDLGEFHPLVPLRISWDPPKRRGLTLFFAGIWDLPSPPCTWDPLILRVNCQFSNGFPDLLYEELLTFPKRKKRRNVTTSCHGQLCREVPGSEMWQLSSFAHNASSSNKQTITFVCVELCG